MTHNDADDAVPWYQGIEFFTALRRLGKKVWLLQYNGEAHNLVERRNRKDLSIRLSQFFWCILVGTGTENASKDYQQTILLHSIYFDLKIRNDLVAPIK